MGWVDGEDIQLNELIAAVAGSLAGALVTWFVVRARIQTRYHAARVESDRATLTELIKTADGALEGCPASP